MKVKKDNIIILLLFLQIINIPYFSARTNVVITLTLGVITFIISFKSLKLNLNYLWPILFFSFVLTISTFAFVKFNDRFLLSLAFAFKYFLYFLVTFYIVSKHSITYFIDRIYYILLPIILVCDILVLVTNGNGIGQDNTGLKFYLIGNKFTLSYLQMLLFCLFSYKNKNILKKIIFALFCIIICKIIDSSTGLIGIFIVILFEFLNNTRLKDILNKPTVYLLFTFILSFLIVQTDYILSFPFVQNFVKNVLHRSLTFTGRLQMFKICITAIKSRPLLGYGLNYDIVYRTLGFGNPQNAILKMLLDHGFLGLAAFIYLIYKTMHKDFTILDNIDNKIFYNLLAFLYGMAVCATVEINFAAIYYFVLAAMMAIGNCNRRSYEKNWNNDYAQNN